MYYQYHCACCDKVVEAGQKECHACGSHNIRSPYGFGFYVWWPVWLLQSHSR